MRVIAFITDPPTIHDILVHLGEPTAPPQIAPARGPPLCDLPDAGPGSFDPQPAFSAKTVIEEARKLVRWSAHKRVSARRVTCCKSTTVCKVSLNECLALLL